jgi:hypothetical protein
MNGVNIGRNAQNQTATADSMVSNKKMMNLIFCIARSSRLTTKAEPRRPNCQPRMRIKILNRRWLRRLVRQHEISISHFVPAVPPGIRIVGAAVGLGGKLILTVSFFGRFGLSGSSSPKPVAITVPCGGRGGFIPPDVAGFGAGLSSSFCIDAQCSLTTKAEPPAMFDPNSHKCFSLKWTRCCRLAPATG